MSPVPSRPARSRPFPIRRRCAPAAPFSRRRGSPSRLFCAASLANLGSPRRRALPVQAPPVTPPKSPVSKIRTTWVASLEERKMCPDNADIRRIAISRVAGPLLVVHVGIEFRQQQADIQPLGAGLFEKLPRLLAIALGVQRMISAEHDQRGRVGFIEPGLGQPESELARKFAELIFVAFSRRAKNDLVRRGLDDAQLFAVD